MLESDRESVAGTVLARIRVLIQTYIVLSQTHGVQLPRMAAIAEHFVGVAAHLFRLY